MKREEHYEFTYINSNGVEKTERVHSKARLESCLNTCKDIGYKVIRTRKLYPFSMMKHQHDFDHINNMCFNRMYDMEAGDIPWDEAEYERLEATRKKAQEFFCMPLPVAWVPWETYKEMKELVVASVCARDIANARARDIRERGDYEEFERDRVFVFPKLREDDWRPGDAPWKAPGMSARDFIR